MIWLSKKNTAFPTAENTDENGILALGGDLSPERLLAAYRNGIFPWYNEGEPITWYCPNPRMVLFFDRLKVSKSLKKILKKELFTITFNTHFQEVIQACKSTERKVLAPGSQTTCKRHTSTCTKRELPSPWRYGKTENS